MIITSIPLSYILARNDAIKYIHSKFNLDKLKELSHSYNLELDTSTLLRLCKGWQYSHHLIQTPIEATRLWLIIDKYFIAPHITNTQFNKNTLSLRYKLHNLEITKELDSDNLDLYFLSYYYREGYRISENEGVGYYITEPYGSKYIIDLCSCNCINYLQKGKCLHLSLAKAYHSNLKIIRHVENSIN